MVLGLVSPDGVPSGWGQGEAVESEAGSDNARHQAPRSGGARRLPVAGGHHRLGSLGVGEVDAENAHRHRRLVRRCGVEHQRSSAVVAPDLVGIHGVPVRPLAGLQQKVDRAARATTLAGGPPALGVPAAFGVGLQAQCVDDRCGLCGSSRGRSCCGGPRGCGLLRHPPHGSARPAPVAVAGLRGRPVDFAHG